MKIILLNLTFIFYDQARAPSDNNCPPFFIFEGGSPYPRIKGEEIANLLQQGRRMPKPKHVDDVL